MKPFLPILLTRILHVTRAMFGLVLLCHGVAEGEAWSVLSPALSAHTITGIVTRVIDGDTLELAAASSMARRSLEAKAAVRSVRDPLPSVVQSPFRFPAAPPLSSRRRLSGLDHICALMNTNLTPPCLRVPRHSSLLRTKPGVLRGYTLPRLGIRHSNPAMGIQETAEGAKPSASELMRENLMIEG